MTDTGKPFHTRIFITLFLAVFVTTMGAGIVAPLLPVYAHSLGAGAFQVGLIFGAFSLTRSLFVPAFGRLSDRRGKKPFITVGLFTYCAVSLLYYNSDHVGTLIAIRLGHGFASAMILPVAQAYVGMITPRMKEGRVMGLFNVSLYGGLSIGPVLGGMVKDFFGIQTSFLSMGGLAFTGFLLCLTLLPPEPRRRGGGGAQAGGVSTPYMNLLTNRTVLALFTFRMCFMIFVGIVWSFLPLLAATRLHLSSAEIGVIVMINVSLAGLFQFPMGYLADRFNKNALVITGGVLALVSVPLIGACRSFESLLLANGLLGLAGGVSFPAVMALGVIEGRRIKAMGSLMGLLALSHSLGMLVGPLLGGVIIDLLSFNAVFIAGGAIITLGILIYFILETLGYGPFNRFHRG